MCDATKIMARVDEKPDMTSSFEKFHGQRFRGGVLPYMMPGRRIVQQSVKSDPKGERCFYLNSGKDHATECSKIMLSPSGTASCSTDVTWGYRRAPFMGEWSTGSGGATATAPPSPAKGGGCQYPNPSTRSAERF